MVMKYYIGIVWVCVLLSLPTPKAYAGWQVDVESAVAYSGYNDVRIPGNTGTYLSLSEELKAEATSYVRLRFTIDWGKRSNFSLLVAPLTIESSGIVDRNIDFNGTRFVGGERLASTYRFDSYRLTYHYALHNSNRFKAGIGLTGKIRDASIQVRNATVSSEKKNTGFVPLINFSFDWRFTKGWGMIFEGDALAAPQGRAEDLLLAFYGNLSDQIRLRLGYRLLEGGADNDEVYAFALVHYLSAGLNLSF